MRSEAETVNGYVAELAEERKLPVMKLRELARKSLPEFSESMRFGMPTYDGKGKVFAFASQKNYISVYVNDAEAVRKHKEDLGKASFGKNCIRYPQLSDIDFGGLQKVVAEAYG